MRKLVKQSWYTLLNSTLVEGIKDKLIISFFRLKQTNNYSSTGKGVINVIRLNIIEDNIQFIMWIYFLYSLKLFTTFVTETTVNKEQSNNLKNIIWS
jgi:hypothetical protein